MKGRKPKQESRSVEFRERLIAWKQTPESLRQSLRALARELGTSHQLLGFYLKYLENWQRKEWLREANEIRARAYSDCRPTTPWEEQRVDDLTRAGIGALAGSALRDSLQRLTGEAKRGPLNWHQIKMRKLLARNGFPEAQELLRHCSQSTVKNPKNNLPAISDGAAKSFRSV